MNMNDTMTVTINEFAEANGVKYPQAAGLILFLKSKGVAKEAGTRPNKGGRGKPPVLYTIPLSVSFTMDAPTEKPVVVAPAPVPAVVEEDEEAAEDTVVDDVVVAPVEDNVADDEDWGDTNPTVLSEVA